MTIQHTPIPHRAYQGTYWNSFPADTECKLPEIVRNRNLFACQFPLLEPWSPFSSWSSCLWFKTMRDVLDHIEWYKALGSPLLLWHDYDTGPDTITFWRAKGFSVLPNMYSFNTVSYGIHFREKNQMMEFLRATFTVVRQQDIPGALQQGAPFDERLRPRP